jgi:superfamily I DNA/RNA helicase
MPSKLNPQQLSAVKTIDHPLLVLAGAGSGKTRVITEKIAYLVQNGIPARHIAAVTFTNKAAREMKNRVSRLLDDKQSRGLTVSTFHSLGLDILRREHKALGYKSAITMFDEQDKISLLRQLVNHVKGCDEDAVEAYSHRIGQWKNAFISPEQALATADTPEAIAAAMLFQQFNRSLKAYNAVDFDDLIGLPVVLFQQHPEILEKWQNKIRYLLVDEYQDTNITQYQLVKALAAKQVVAEIVHHRFKTGGQYGDYAILYRGNHQSRLFERELRESNVPYFISGSTSFFAYAEIKDILAYLRLVVNRDDDAAFLRVINTPRREIGPSTLEKLGAYANERHISLFAASTEFGLQQRISEKSQQRLSKFCDFLNQTASKIESGDSFAAIEKMVDDIHYPQWLNENSKTQAAAERKLKNVYELIEWLQRIAGNQQGEEKTLSEVIAKVMLLDILDRNQEQEAGDQVSLMTLHAAKGLEFPHVFLIGMEENLLPHQNSIETDNIEEERRLAYVGITRAQKTLTFSYCTHRKRYGEMAECEPSRFLAELPEDDLEWSNKKQLPPEEIKQRGKASLAALKSMLSD